MKKAIAMSVVFLSVAALAQIAPDAPVLEHQAPSGLSGWFALLALPLMGLLQVIVRALPENGLTKIIAKILDVFAANVSHKK